MRALAAARMEVCERKSTGMKGVVVVGERALTGVSVSIFCSFGDGDRARGTNAWRSMAVSSRGSGRGE